MSTYAYLHKPTGNSIEKTDMGICTGDTWGSCRHMKWKCSPEEQLCPEVFENDSCMGSHTIKIEEVATRPLSEVFSYRNPTDNHRCLTIRTETSD